MKRVLNISAGVFLGQFILAGFSPAQSGQIDLIIPSIPENLGQSETLLQGPHGNVIKKVLDRLDGKVSYRIAHPTHAYTGFHKNLYTCVTPDSVQYYDPKLNFIETNAIHTSTWVVIQKKDTPSISKRDDLLGKRVGTLYKPEELFNVVPQHGTQYTHNAKLERLLKMLSRGRLDFVVSPKLGLDSAISKSGLTNLSFTKPPPIAKVANAVMCHNTDRGRKIIELFNSHLDKLD